MVGKKRCHRQGSDVPATFSLNLCREIQKPWIFWMSGAVLLLWHLDISQLILGVLYSGGLILIAVFDYRYMMIYDRLVLGLLIMGMLPLLNGKPLLGDACLGLMLGGGSLWIVRLIFPHGMGWGDVKLAAAIGVWLGLSGMCICLYIAFLTGTLYGLCICWHRKSLKNVMVPFGPFLALGAIVSFSLVDYWEDIIEAWWCQW